MEPHGDPRHHTPGPSGAKGSPKRKGRPVGSVALTPEVERAILDAIRAGAMDYVAAEAAGVSQRTFYDWMARGEDRHPSRPGTPQLRAFAMGVRRAQAEARAAAEAVVFKRHPKAWLAHAARTTPDRPGWTTPEQDRRTEGVFEQWMAELDRTDSHKEEDRPRGPGRPRGSVSPRPDAEQTILALVRQGVFASVAAQTAGVAPRTFHDWMARGEGRHPTRPPTRRLQAFAKAVRTARAQARMDAETRVHQEDPRHWLAHAAPTTSEEQGWSEPPPREGLQGLDRSSEEGLQDWLARVLEDRGAPPEECQQPTGDPPGRSPRPEGRSVDAITAELYG